ncbi:MAG: hypothetical protein KDA96_25955 [Planctomycetaceae bacterium]|nr:hypothetical protein [Planctomycetaceae bacterium]
MAEIVSAGLPVYTESKFRVLPRNGGKRHGRLDFSCWFSYTTPRFQAFSGSAACAAERRLVTFCTEAISPPPSRVWRFRIAFAHTFQMQVRVVAAQRFPGLLSIVLTADQWKRTVEQLAYCEWIGL